MPPYVEALFTDVAAAVVSGMMLFGYFALTRRRARRAPIDNVQSLNEAVRDAWIRYVLHDPARGLQGVQTLRNSTMAATFFSSTAVLLIIGTMNMIDQADRFAQIWGNVAIPGGGHHVLWTVKVLLIVTALFAAFFCFAMSVRFFNHVGYQIALPKGERPEWLTEDGVAEMMGRAGTFYSIGMRAYFVTVPLVFWLFGPAFMLAATVATLLLLAYLERAPTSGRNPRSKRVRGPRK